MIKKFLKNVFAPFQYIRRKTRPWRRRRSGLERRLLENEKITRELVFLNAWDLRRKILAEPRYIEEKRLPRFGFKGYSQNDEDGIIQEIFRRIGTANKTFVEIGVSSGLECNTLYLLLQGWRGLWVEGCSEFVDLINQKFAFALNNGTLKVKHAWVQRENINQLIAERREGSEDLDLLSLDIDGNDYHVLEAMDLLNARVVIVEYSPKYQPPVKWVMKYNPSHSYDGFSDYLGASLKSFEILLSAKGYKLVGCSLFGINAFFVRADLVKNHFLDDCSAENHFEPERFFLQAGLTSLHAANFGPFQIK
jgi:hypothetical protein